MCLDVCDVGGVGLFPLLRPSRLVILESVSVTFDAATNIHWRYVILCDRVMQCAILVPQPGNARAIQRKRQKARRMKAQKAVAVGGSGVSDPGTSAGAVDEDSDED